MLKNLYQLIFWSSLCFLAVSTWALTFGQRVSYEFNNPDLSSDFYQVLFGGTPIAILLTLFGTLKMQQSSQGKLVTVFITLALSLFSFLFLLNNLFTIGFGGWTTFNIAYEYKTNPEIQIREQRYDVGALGYRGNRVVEVKPVAFLFWEVAPIDTTRMDKSLWKRVDKEGDIKFP